MNYDKYLESIQKELDAHMRESVHFNEEYITDCEVIMENNKLIIERLDKSLPLPTYKHAGDAGFDLYAAQDAELCFGVISKVRLGIKMQIPEGFEIQLRPRSGLAANWGVTLINSPGTIDAGFRGELVAIMTTMQNHGIVKINKGDRVCQAVLSPITKATIIDGCIDQQTSRGDGGLGSTGV